MNDNQDIKYRPEQNENVPSSCDADVQKSPPPWSTARPGESCREKRSRSLCRCQGTGWEKLINPCFPTLKTTSSHAPGRNGSDPSVVTLHGTCNNHTIMGREEGLRRGFIAANSYREQQEFRTLQKCELTRAKLAKKEFFTLDSTRNWRPKLNDFKTMFTTFGQIWASISDKLTPACAVWACQCVTCMPHTRPVSQASQFRNG